MATVRFRTTITEHDLNTIFVDFDNGNISACGTMWDAQIMSDFIAVLHHMVNAAQPATHGGNVIPLHRGVTR